MKILAILATCMALTACNATATKVLSSSPRTVAIQSFKGMSDAQKLADAECARHGRFARWISGDLNYVFDCIQ